MNISPTITEVFNFMENIKDFKLTTELKNDKSGYSKWGFAEKNGREYFIKEFLTPIYPTDDTNISLEQMTRKRKICFEFEHEKNKFYSVLSKCNTGNIVTVLEFFRYKTKYYIVTEKIDASPIEPSDIYLLSLKQKILIMKVIIYCIDSLHKHGIVHGDIKPDNILFKKTAAGIYTAKIIDFDSSFIASENPSSEELQGDMVYLAPESFLHMAGGNIIITTKIDIFALGVLFHQYFTGELPIFDKEKYTYAFESVLDGNVLGVSKTIPEKYRRIIESMLDKHPARRPNIEEISSAFNSDERKSIENITGDPGGRRSNLIITMRTKDDRNDGENNSGLKGDLFLKRSKN